jgi:hypothetical protein
MLSHQLAAAHNGAMRLTGLAMVHTHNAEQRCGYRESFAQCQQHGIEAATLANAAARMMAAFNDGMLTLAKIRNGARQTGIYLFQTASTNAGCGASPPPRRTGGRC